LALASAAAFALPFDLALLLSLPWLLDCPELEALLLSAELAFGSDADAWLAPLFDWLLLLVWAACVPLLLDWLLLVWVACVPLLVD